MNKSIEAARRRVKKAKDNLTEVVQKVQLACKHDDIYRSDYEPDRFFGGVMFAPTAVCGECGMSEDGWSPEILKALHPKNISRSEMYKMREGLMIRAEDSTAIRRGEVTLTDLITGTRNVL